MTNQNSRLPELLAPAGSPDALQAAVAAGADAVYLGGELFSCRMRARNFREDELADALALCRDAGVASYVTLNIRLRDEELSDALRMAASLWNHDVSGLIVSDPGLAALLHRELPELPLHASTQLSCLSGLDGAALRDAGFCRMVCPRELAADEIAALVRSSPIGIEMFVHGAHCVSFSGQCLLSFAMGGRSGNRGECAQSCRLPYRVVGPDGSAGPEGYPLSLRDLCLAAHVPAILDSGVASLKIEGRQKSAAYVYGVTRAWRTLLDERRAASPEEVARLADLFSRQGFTDGYFTRRYRRMGGIRTAGNSSASREAEASAGPIPPIRRALHGHVRAVAGEPVRLLLTDGARTGSAEGAPPLPAEKQPLTEALLREALGKTGGTVFCLESLTAELSPQVFLTRGQLNSLRREALADLTDTGRRTVNPERIAEAGRPRPQGQASAPAFRPRRIGSFLSREQIPPEASLFFDEIRLPLSACRPGSGHVPVLPAVLSDQEIPSVRRALQALRPPCAVAHSPGQLRLLRELGIEGIASMRFTVMNGAALRAVETMGASRVEVSPELTAAAVRHLPGPKEMTVYGRLPLMYLMRCVLSGGGETCRLHGAGGGVTCPRGGHDCRGGLRDRMGITFPVISQSCRSVLYNSVPLYMGDRPEEIRRLGLDGEIYAFTTETSREAAEVLRAVADGRPLAAHVRRIR